MKKLILLLMATFMLLTGCSSVSTVVKKRNLATQTQMSETIWLNPEYVTDKTVFLQIKNTTTKQLSIDNGIKNILMSKGYKITTNPKKANYWLQINVLKLDKQDIKNDQSTEAGLVGAGIGGTLAAYNTGSMNSAIGIGLLGGIVGTAVDSLIEDVQYVMITDLVVSERTGRTVNVENINMIKQGTRGVSSVTSQSTSGMNRYQTRVVSTANKVNLKFEEATPMLENELERSISNIF